MKNKLEITKKLPIYGLYIVALFPLFNIKLVSISIIIFSFFSLIYLFSDFKNRWNPDYKSFFLTSLPISLYLIGLLYTDDYHSAMKVFDTGLPLLIFPLLYFVIIGRKFKISLLSKNKIIDIFIISGSFLILLIFGYLIYSGAIQSLFNVDAAIKATQNKGSDVIRNAINTAPFIGEHPTYLGLISLFVSLLSFLRLREDNNLFLLPSIIIGISGIFISGSKMTILTLFILILIIIFMFINSRKYKLILLFSISLSIIILFIVFPTLNTRFGQVIKTKFEPPKGVVYNSTNVRIAVYQCTFENINKSPIIGLGTAGYISGMKRCFHKFNTDIFKKSNFYYNSHNQYLSFVLSNGIIGLVIFLFWICIFYKLAIKYSNYYLLFSMIIFTLMFMTENLLERQTGVVLFNFLIPFFLRYNSKDVIN